MTRRDDLYRAVTRGASTLDERLLLLGELARKDRRLTQSDVVWCRLALLADVQRERDLPPPPAARPRRRR